MVKEILDKVLNIDYFTFRKSNYVSLKSIAQNWTSCPEWDLPDYKHIAGIKLADDTSLYLFIKGEKFVWIGVHGGEETAFTSPDWELDPESTNFHFEVLESSLES